MIELKNVSIRYLGQHSFALRDINLKVKRGEFVGIIGPTGAGKSTLCTMLNGLIPNLIKTEEYSGDVIVNGMNTRKHRVAELSEHVGIVFQDYESQLFCTTVMLEAAFGPENLALPKKNVLERVENSLRWTGLSGLKKRYTFSLSGGQKQRLAIAAMLSMQPEIIVLDEATSDLDPVGKVEIYRIVKSLREAQKQTLIMVDHHLDRVAEVADRIIVLNDGRIIYDGTPDEVFSRVDELKEMGLRPPQVTELFHRLKPGNGYPLDVDEALKRFPKRIRIGHPKEKLKPKGERPTAVEIRDLWHTYDEETWALKRVNLSVLQGEFLALIGPNGSGKTTLAQCVNGIVKPTRGSIRVLGREATVESVSELGKRVGYVFQNPDYQIFCNTVREELAVGPRGLGLSKEEVEHRVENSLRTLGIEGLADEDPFFLNKANRERVAVGTVLTLEPEIIILDEPTTGLSPGEVRKMMDLARSLNRSGKTIITITHDMWIVAEYCERTLLLNEGEIQMDGSTRRVFSQADLLKQYSIEPPQICQFTRMLKGETFLSVDELLANLTGR